jgi:beta-xylosidase
VVSDYGAVTFLQLMYRIAATEGEAAAYALAAGLDVELPNTVCYGEPLFAEIAAGRVDEALVDRALRRVLAQKLQLGLLDAGWSPEPVDDGIDFDSAGNRDIARRMAESSIVLLDNPTGLLPLQAPQRIAVIGPCADEPQTFFGCYAFPNHVIPQSSQLDQGIGIVADSLLDALRAEFPSAEVRYESGCLVSGGDLSGVAAAVDEAARPTWWCWRSATGPACSGAEPPGRAATPRTSICRVINPSLRRRSWRPGGRPC